MPRPNDIVGQVAENIGVPPIIPMTIMLQESGGNFMDVTKDTNGYNSYGLFQLNEQGLGKGYTRQQLLNPTVNARIAIQAMKPWYDKGYSNGLRGFALDEYVANNAGWPGELGVAKTQQVEPQYDQGLQQQWNTEASSYGEQQANATAPPTTANPASRLGEIAGSNGQNTNAVISQWLGTNLQLPEILIVITGTVLIAVLLYRLVTK